MDASSLTRTAQTRPAPAVALVLTITFVLGFIFGLTVVPV